MERVAIIGMGLMGGSLGLALKRRSPAAHVAAYARRPESRKAILARGLADAVHDSPAAAAAGADVVVFCTPVLTIPAILRTCVSGLGSGCLVTDVGSTKAELMEAVKPWFKAGGAQFVGSHPMTGSEKAGLEAARDDLYQGCTVALTPGANGEDPAVARARKFWESIGGRVIVMDAAAHDELVARTSHLPHLAAAALVRSVGRDGLAHLARFCGPGFRDTTRVASGSPDLWHDIVKSNQAAVRAELREFQRALAQLSDLLDAGDFEAVRGFLDASRAKRDSLLKE